MFISARKRLVLCRPAQFRKAIEAVHSQMVAFAESGLKYPNCLFEQALRYLPVCLIAGGAQVIRKTYHVLCAIRMHRPKDACENIQGALVI